jgi:ribosomal protein S18 acetylase RimI-like enzyme
VFVREGRPADAEAIERIRVRGWQVAYRHIYPPAFLDKLPVDSSRWHERLTSPPEGWSSFVAETAGEVIGFAICGPSRDEPGSGELYALYVRPDSWSSGVGRALLARAEERLEAEYDTGLLWVLAENAPARGFYERGGWRLDGATKPFEHAGVIASAVLYRKLLRSWASRS